jgi:hypothetical protein
VRFHASCWATIILLLACHHQRPVEVVPQLVQLGCYRIDISEWEPRYEWGGDQIYIVLPPALRLRAERRPDDFPRGMIAEPIPAESPETHSMVAAAWHSYADGRIVIVWGNGFSGTALDLRPSPSGYSGTARTFWDFGRSEQRARARLWRLPCP